LRRKTYLSWLIVATAALTTRYCSPESDNKLSDAKQEYDYQDSRECWKKQKTGPQKRKDIAITAYYSQSNENRYDTEKHEDASLKSKATKEV